MAEIFDLFGDPVPANYGRRGRPQHIATVENCNKVKMLLALGWSNERIASAVGITQPTLRRNYFQVLKFRGEFRDRLEARRAMLLWSECEKGNVAALREFDRLVEKNDLLVGHRSFYDGQRAAPHGDDDDAAATPKLGKKEAAAAAAETAGEDTDWGSDLKPPMN